MPHNCHRYLSTRMNDTLAHIETNHFKNSFINIFSIPFNSYNFFSFLFNLYYRPTFFTFSPSICVTVLLYVFVLFFCCSFTHCIILHVTLVRLTSGLYGSVFSLLQKPANVRAVESQSQRQRVPKRTAGSGEAA